MLDGGGGGRGNPPPFAGGAGDLAPGGFMAPPVLGAPEFKKLEL